MAKREEARRIYHMDCCGERCLHTLGKSRAYPLIESCLEEVEKLDRYRKHDYIFNKLLSAAAGLTSQGNYPCQLYND